LLRTVAPSPELMVILAVGRAAGVASVADEIGLVKEPGRLLAGASLAATPRCAAIG